MTEENYRKAIKDAEEEVTRLTLYRASVDRKLAQLKAAITALSSLLEEPPKVEDPTIMGDVGISTAIRQTLKEAGAGLTPAQIKAKLTEAEFDLSKYANSSAVIHNTLKRLEGQGEILAVRDSSGITAYAVNPFTRVDESIAKAIETVREAASRPVPIPSFADVTGQAVAAFEQKIADYNAAGAKSIEQFHKKTGGFK
jgi:hypothetical protein